VDLLRKSRFDIVVIGAGPAGASTSYFSKYFDRDNELDVLLVESLSKEKFDRYHSMCGEVVSALILKDFPNIDIYPFIKNKIDKVVEQWHDITIESKLKGFVLDRPKFLQHLIGKFREMGGYFLNDKFIKIRVRNEKIKILMKSGKTVETRYLVLATGPNLPELSFISGLKVDTLKTLLCQVLVEEHPIEENHIFFFYDEKYKGDYKWVFPYGSYVKIGTPFENRMELPEKNVIRKDVKPVCCGILKRYNMGNILLVGDAAFQNNALTKGGIRIAINAGKLAAKSIVTYNDPARYSKLWEKSKYFGKIYLDTYRRLSKMKNKEISHHCKPLRYFPLSLPIIFLKYKKYADLYKAYNLSSKYGW